MPYKKLKILGRNEENPKNTLPTLAAYVGSSGLSRALGGFYRPYRRF
jgi:hypothetical protein